MGVRQDPKANDIIIYLNEGKVLYVQIIRRFVPKVDTDQVILVFLLTVSFRSPIRLRK